MVTIQRQDRGELAPTGPGRFSRQMDFDFFSSEVEKMLESQSKKEACLRLDRDLQRAEALTDISDVTVQLE